MDFSIANSVYCLRGDETWKCPDGSEKKEKSKAFMAHRKALIDDPSVELDESLWKEMEKDIGDWRNDTFWPQYVACYGTHYIFALDCFDFSASSLGQVGYLFHGGESKGSFRDAMIHEMPTIVLSHTWGIVGEWAQVIDMLNQEEKLAGITDQR